MIVTMQDYTITDRAPVLIGYEGENLSRNFTVKTFDDLSGIASIELLIGDVNCGAMTVNDTEITISLDAIMIGRAGYKKAQLIMLDDTGAVIMKSNQFDVLVGASNNPRYYAAGEKVKTLTVSIDGRTRQIILPAGFAVSVNGDVAVDHISFKAPASYGDFDFSSAACRVDWTGVDGTSHTNICTEKDADGNWIWALPTALTRGGEGEISFSVSYVVTDATTGAVTADWNTGLVKFHHLESAKSDDAEEDVEEETTYDRLASAIAAVQSAQASVDDVNAILAGITSATPTVVETVADLNGLDTSKVKLAIVAADGYLYYYDGTAWKSGFAYGGLQEIIAARTDSDGVTHADLKTRLNTAEAQIKEDLSDIQTATEEDAEQIDALNEQMEMLLDKAVIVPSPTGISIQCVDLSTARYDRDRYYSITIRLPYVGRYDYNPSNLNLGAFYLKAKNAKGESVVMYKNGSATSVMNFVYGGYFVLENRRTLKSYKNTGVLNDTFTFDDDVFSLYDGMIGMVESGSGQQVGVTWGEASETYVPYDPTDFDTPTEYNYSPNPDYADAIQEYFATNGFIDKTLSIEGRVADSKAVGDELYDQKGIHFETVNGWIRPGDGALITNTNNTATDFIFVNPGETIRVNRPAIQDITDNAFYNASKGFVSAFTTPSSVNDITIPENVYYVRFSDKNSAMVGFTVERTGLWTRIRDAISESSGEAEYRHLIDQSRYSGSSGNPLTLLHFSDLHMDATTMGFINTFRLKYADLLDDTIQTGDVCNGFGDNWETLVSLGLGECFGVIGNHEALRDGLKNSATQQELHEKFIKPYISAWNVTQPTGVDDSTSEHYCANYYYKDYTSATIRLIVLDTQKWSSAQMTWFVNTLESARTAGYAVIVASHVLPGKVTITDCNFSAKYVDGSNVGRAFPTSDAPLVTEDVVGAVNDFITAGGEFVLWFGGHEHADIFGVFTNYPNVTAYMIDKASINRETPGAARISGEKNQHAFNIMSVVRSGKLLKIVRIGEDVDGFMRGKHVFCYNYSTKTIISQW